MGDFAMTAAVWLRVALDQLYGVHPSAVTWFAGRARRRLEGIVLDFEDRFAGGAEMPRTAKEVCDCRIIDPAMVDLSVIDCVLLQ